MNTDPAHKVAFNALEQTVAVASTIRAHPDIVKLRAFALGAGTNDRQIARRGLKLSFATALAAAIVFFGFVLNSRLDGLPISDRDGSSVTQSVKAHQTPDTSLHLSTSIGEQLTRALDDGSTIELNTNSKIRVALNANSRVVYMLRGQAVFDVAHDENRPFIVYAGDRKVTALGTLFEVRMEDSSTRVTLMEGKVRVDEINLLDPDTAPKLTPVVELRPGERFVSNEENMSSLSEQDMESDLSWRQGRHIFVDATLSHIILELNRYTTRKIVLDDPAIGDLVASANFKLGSTRSLAAALEVNFDLSVIDDPQKAHIQIGW